MTPPKLAGSLLTGLAVFLGKTLLCANIAGAYSGMPYGTRLGKASVILVPSAVVLALAAYLAAKSWMRGMERRRTVGFLVGVAIVVLVSLLVTVGSLDVAESMNWTAGNIVLAGIGPVAMVAARRRLDGRTLLMVALAACASFIVAKYVMILVSMTRNVIVRLLVS